MGRTKRLVSCSGYYHVILRGVNRQIIFQDDEDHERMIACLKHYSNETDTEIITYCLMNNHIHLLIHAKEGPSLFIKKVASSYVYYYNRKYERFGHLFQDRYKSEPIDTDTYFLTAARYIIRNPEKAGICPAEKYRWNSWHEIYGHSVITNIDMLIQIAGGKQELMDYILTDAEDECMDIDTIPKYTEQNAAWEITQLTGFENPAVIKDLPRDTRKQILAELKNTGIPLRQLEKLTGVSRKTIRNA